MLSTLIVASVVLCCVIGNVVLHSDSFESSFRASLFSNRAQDEDDLLEEEHKVEGENRIIAMLAQIIREMRVKYSPEPDFFSSEPQFFAPESRFYDPVTEYETARTPELPPAPLPDFTYHFPQIDLASADFSRINFAVKPNEPQYYQSDFPPKNFKKEVVAVANEEQSDDVERGPYSRTPRPRFGPPVVIVVKDMGEDERKKDATRGQHAHPHLKTHSGKLNGRPKWISNSAADNSVNQESHVFITKDDGFDDDTMYFIALVAGCSAALLLVIAVGVYSWYKLQRNSKLGADIKYPAFTMGGVTKNGTPPSSGDRRLAHSAQMYHYQHQKQQILALENNTRDQRRGSVSDADSDDDHDADHTVYECPTLPMTSKKTPDIEVKKPTVETKPTPSLPSSNTPEDNTQDSQAK